jgi:hypothetical protein
MFYQLHHPLLSVMDSNVFLVPCNSDNFDRTVCSEIDVTEYSDYPPALSDVNKVRLWGAREGSNNQKYFEKMESSDLLLFYQDDTYIGTGRVGTKFIDEEGWVSTTFWDGAPSYYIYTIEEFTAVSVPKSKVNRIFDYDLDYYPEGLIPVAENRLGDHSEAIELVLQRYSEKHG